MNNYAVYRNVNNSKAMLHQVSCPWYKRRGGIHNVAKGEWRDFESEMDAVAYQRSLNKRETRRCGKCSKAAQT